MIIEVQESFASLAQDDEAIGGVGNHISKILNYKELMLLITSI